MDEIDTAALGSLIQKLREAKGWTRYRLAARADISDVYLIQIETGRSKRVGVNIIAKLARALGITVDALLSDLGMQGAEAEKMAAFDEEAVERHVAEEQDSWPG